MRSSSARRPPAKKSWRTRPATSSPSRRQVPACPPHFPVIQTSHSWRINAAPFCRHFGIDIDQEIGFQARRRPIPGREGDFAETGDRIHPCVLILHRSQCCLIVRDRGGAGERENAGGRIETAPADGTAPSAKAPANGTAPGAKAPGGATASAAGPRRSANRRPRSSARWWGRAWSRRSWMEGKTRFCLTLYILYSYNQDYNNYIILSRSHCSRALWETRHQTALDISRSRKWRNHPDWLSLADDWLVGANY